jgi:glycosyltransferase involved in cell wall biosynthesis
VFIALTEFARHKFIESGLPAEKIMVKPNFVHPDPGFGYGKRQYALFVGRLSPEKGIDVLLRTWERLNGCIPLKIAGTGPLAQQVIAATRRIPRIEYLGQRSTQEIYDLMQGALFLVVPSEWYEGMPCTILEAFSTGTPVLAANLGAMSTVVQDGSTGLHFAPGNVDDLVAKVEWMREHAVARTQMGRDARTTFESNYTAERTYQRLMDIYTHAITHAQGRTTALREEQIINARE